MKKNEPLKGKIWLISELADFEVVRNWETNRFGFPVVECVCPHCGYEFSEEDIKKLAKVEYYDEEVVRLEDVKSAVQGLLEDVKKEFCLEAPHCEGNNILCEKCKTINKILEKIKKWFADVFEVKRKWTKIV